MQLNDLQMKRVLRTALLVLLLNVMGMGKGYAYDFSAVCETGQTLYYNISDTENHYVELTCPQNPGWDGWNGYDKPVGNIIIPRTVYDNEDNQYYVTTIGNYAFMECSGLTMIEFPNTIISIGDMAFYGCNGLTSIDFPNFITSIGTWSFCNCSGLSGTLVIPNSVTTIGSMAFHGCSGLTGTLIIPTTVTSILGNPFSGCIGLEGIFVESGNTRYDSRDNCNAIIRTWTNELVVGCKNTIIPNTITSIGDGAFYECSSLTGTLVIPNSVTSIGTDAFYGCSGLTGSLVIPNSVTSLGNNAFTSCSGLNGSLVLPNSITSISYMAFCGCNNLSGTLVIPNSVTSIEDAAFYYCSGFTGSLDIPNSVTFIGDGSFYGCSGLTGSLDIPNSVTSIGRMAFYNCSGFSGTLTMPNTITSIRDNTYYGCSGLTGVLTIPSTITSIEENAFYGCSGFTGTLNIPNSLTTIGENAFYGCSGFEEIIVETSNTMYDSRNNCNAIVRTDTNELILGCKNTVIPNTITSIYNNAFVYCNGLTSIDLPTSITTIGNSSFARTGLTSIIIPDSVISIGSGAFDYCHNLTAAVIGSSVASIGRYAFDDTGLTSVLMLSSTPPVLEHYSPSYSTFPIRNEGFVFYVPYESIDAYKTANLWTYYEQYIRGWVQKSILGYGNSNGGWHFIASPVLSNIAPTEVNGMISETDYDLYRFNQSAELEWENYKYPDHTEGFTINNRKGYLYASKEDVNLMFKGVFNEFEEQRVTLAYDANAIFAGWNLVGNPFPVSAFANRSYYVMNEDGTAIEPVSVSSETAIAPCIGVMVKAETTGELVTFSKTAPEAAVNQGVLQIAVVRSNTRGNAIEDKAIVSFNAGDHLEKFVFNKDNATLCIPQGGKDLAIAYTEKVGEMPLNFKAAKNGEYTITVNPEAVEMNYLHLIDNMTGNDIDLLASPSYSFNAQTTDYASRFCLVFSICEDANGDNGDFAFISNGDIIINGEGMVQVIDMAGHIIVSVDEYTRCIPTTGMTSGVYVLRLINGNDVKTQKIVVR